jgi:hypothetical protein
MGVRDTIAKALMGIKAYHSSPHDFDKFDLKKIGTGEGAQVYGHGLYFAENPAVSGQGGQYWNQFTKKFEGPEYLAAGKLKQAGFDRDAAAALAQKDVDALTEALKTGAQPPGLQGGPFDEQSPRRPAHLRGQHQGRPGADAGLGQAASATGHTRRAVGIAPR